MTSPEPLGRIAKSEYAYRSIRERILAGDYARGARLVLDQLARELSVSVVPVREAIRRLEAEGFVTYQRNVGAQVIGIDLDQYSHAMESLALLEGYATALSAPVLEAADLDRAREANARMRHSLDPFDPVGFTTGNREFHEILCSRCPNTHLRSMIGREWSRLDMLRRSSFTFVPERAERSVEEHDILLQLISVGAPAEQIESFARNHKLRTASALSAAVEGRPE
jgi:DNA-binding GntR family transcriptional regulator